MVGGNAGTAVLTILSMERPFDLILALIFKPGMIGMSKEHLAIALALSVPVIVAITKVNHLSTPLIPVIDAAMSFRLT